MKNKYSIISCSHRLEYLRMHLIASLRDPSHLAEVIAIENIDNQYSVPQALNIGRTRATGAFLVFCHHDIIFPDSWIEKLDAKIKEIESIDPDWGVIGVMGVSRNGKHVGSIEDPHSERRMGKLPALVQSLDEVCLVIRSNSNLWFDEEIGGYHLYGADICLQARQNGHKCYAIDACFQHLSTGKVDQSFYKVSKSLRNKWAMVKGSPWVIETTCGVFALRHAYLTKLIAALMIIRRRICWRMGSVSDFKYL